MSSVQKSRQQRSLSSETNVVKPSRRNPVNRPEITSIDVLATVSDEEMINRLRSYEESRQRVIDNHQDPRPWEEEISYIKRELQIRRSRRDAHEQYVKKLEQEYSNCEKNLPMADLDNTNFLRIVGEIN